MKKCKRFFKIGSNAINKYTTLARDYTQLYLQVNQRI
jgi:hypothetical protein